MNILILCFLVFLVVYVIFMVFWGWLVKKLYKSDVRSKMSPFECGMVVKENSRLPFSLRFFFLLMLFLVFDVELTFLLQLPFFVFSKFFLSRLVIFFFTMFLLVGVLEEWRRGALDWV